MTPSRRHSVLCPVEDIFFVLAMACLPGLIWLGLRVGGGSPSLANVLSASLWALGIAILFYAMSPNVCAFTPLGHIMVAVTTYLPWMIFCMLLGGLGAGSALKTQSPLPRLLVVVACAIWPLILSLPTILAYLELRHIRE